ncbi:MAG: glycosyltransferase [Acidobacteriaceae bacterium]|nr:glycosyltransferase [Acidobacteriaceae bacterium]
MARNFSKLLLIGTAGFLGVVIAREQWLFLIPVAAIPLVLLWPVQMSLGMFAFILPFDSVAALDKEGIGTTLNFIIGAASGLILLTTGIVTRRLERPPRAALWWGLFVLWSALTVLWALEPETALGRLPTVFASFLLYVAAVCFRMTRKELSGVLLLAMLGGIIAAGYASLNFMRAGGGERATLVLGERTTNPNQFAAIMLLPLSLALGRFISSRGWVNRIAMMASVAVIAFAILLSMSRGSLIAVGALIVVYVYRIGVHRRMVLAVSVLILLLFAMPDLFFTRVQGGIISRAAGRFDIWQVGLTAFKHYGIFGAGLDNFPVAYDKFVGDAPRFPGYRNNPHNIYLGISVEMGIVGLLLFLGAVRSQLRAVQRFQADANGLVPPVVVACEAACWGMLVAGFSGSFVWNKVFWLSWILLAIAVRVVYREKAACDSAGTIETRLPRVVVGQYARVASHPIGTNSFR